MNGRAYVFVIASLSLLALLPPDPVEAKCRGLNRLCSAPGERSQYKCCAPLVCQLVAHETCLCLKSKGAGKNPLCGQQ
jgi:hypothetical protein